MKTQAMRIPRASERAAWQGIDPRFSSEILSAAQGLSQEGYPAVRATQYMAYVRDGSRRAYEAPYFARRQRLVTAALAECIQREGQYLDEVTDGIWCICEETSWCISAHNTNGMPLPDVDNPVIDLFAAQTASTLSWVVYLLEDSLLPIVTERVQKEVSRRVLQPFAMREDYWWMGIVRQDLNNWTPWILANCLGTAHIWGADIDGKASVILDRWLACIPEDGGLDEGVAYWNMAGGSLLDCLEHLGADRYGERKIRNLAAFPLHAHIHGTYYINFADCDAQPMLDGERLYTFGHRTGNEALKQLGASVAAAEGSVLPRDTPEIYRVLCKLFCTMQTAPSEVAPEDADYPDLGLWIRSRGGLFAAFKGGHNAESHNHNDVGSFIVFVDGKPAIVDAGNMVYTARTFQEATRYTLWNTRSMNHNLPLIGGVEQLPGEQYRAKAVSFGPEEASMDIADAYGAEAGVEKLLRSMSVSAEKVVLQDRISLISPKEVEWVFILRNKPSFAAGYVAAGNVYIAYDAALEAAYTEYPVTDTRMAKNYPGTLYRLTLKAAAAAEHHQAFAMGRLEA